MDFKVHKKVKHSNYLFEFEDLTWFPNIIRESMTDYLRYVLTALRFYQPTTPLIIETLIRANSTQIIDLCSGGGGAIEQIMDSLNQANNGKINFLLTDKFPNVNAFQFLAFKTNNQISFSASSIDAANVPSELTGIRTILSGFHHFNELSAKSILKNAVQSRAGLAIFDGGNKSILTALFILLFHPLAFFLFTPFFKPFRFSRLLFTYLIPIIPICTIWDGMVSISRLYDYTELLKMAEEVESTTYYWKAGKLKASYGLHVTYLIGYPKEK